MINNDQLLGQIDERTLNIEESVDKIEKHLAHINGTVAKNCLGIESSRLLIDINYHKMLDNRKLIFSIWSINIMILLALIGAVIINSIRIG